MTASPLRISPEDVMRKAFGEQARAAIADAERFNKASGGCKVGIESELGLIADRTPHREIEVTRDLIINEASPDIDQELGAAQIELRTAPHDLTAVSGFSRIAHEYRSTFNRLLTAARRHGTKVLRLGANPFLPTIGTPRTNTKKYRLVPDHYNQHRDPRRDTMIGLGRHRVDIGDAAIVALFQSVQFNVEATSFDDAIDKMNRSFGIAQYLLAISRNARFVQCTDTAMSDVRMMSWETSHDHRLIADTQMQDIRVDTWERTFNLNRPGKDENELRVGLPRRYFRCIRDYLKRCGSFPFILDNPANALRVAIGMTWLDTRVKFIGDSLVVELRLLSTQPSIDDELALMLLYLGRLTDAQDRSEQLLPIELVRENRLAAMLYGRREPMWFLDANGQPQRMPFDDGFTVELARAKRGLFLLGLESHLDGGVIANMLEKGSPSVRLASSLSSEDELISPPAMRQALADTGMLVS